MHDTKIYKDKIVRFDSLTLFDLCLFHKCDPRQSLMPKIIAF